MMSAVFSMVGGLIVFIASCALLDGLRKEEERAFRFWLWTMVIKSSSSSRSIPKKVLSYKIQSTRGYDRYMV